MSQTPVKKIKVAKKNQNFIYWILIFFVFFGTFLLQKNQSQFLGYGTDVINHNKTVKFNQIEVVTYQFWRISDFHIQSYALNKICISLIKWPFFGEHVHFFVKLEKPGNWILGCSVSTKHSPGFKMSMVWWSRNVSVWSYGFDFFLSIWSWFFLCYPDYTRTEMAELSVFPTIS